MSEVADRVATSPHLLRPARDEDLGACTLVWRDGLAGYLERLNVAPPGSDLEPLRRLLAHCRATDPERFWVAVADEDGPAEERDADGRRVIGFGSATVRGSTWFLGMLFVRPGHQASGLGRALLERTFVADHPPSADDPSWAFGTATDSAQPISNALYARYGMAPRVPIYHLLGRPRPDVLPRLPDAIEGIPAADLVASGDGVTPDRVAEAVDEIDRAVLGYAHRADHDYLVREGKALFVYRSRDGHALGYGYAAPSGRVGPVAALDDGLVAPIVGHLLETVVPPDASSLWVPGSAGEAFSTLLHAGLRLDGFPALLLWTRPIADFARYLPISLALP